jgi:hypothetical protein
VLYHRDSVVWLGLTIRTRVVVVIVTTLIIVVDVVVALAAIGLVLGNSLVFLIGP